MGSQPHGSTRRLDPAFGQGLQPHPFMTRQAVRHALSGFLACAIGGWAGLVWDTRAVPLSILAAACSESAGPWDVAWRHWQALPGAHSGMVIAAFWVPGGGLALRLGHAAGMAGCMAITATVGGSVWPLLAVHPAVAMGVTMAFGMAMAHGAFCATSRRALRGSIKPAGEPGASPRSRAS